MSKTSDQLETDLVSFALKHKGKTIPINLPKWMMLEGIIPGSIIKDSKRMGADGHDVKTDVIIYLENSAPIKISAKLSNADYYGNWYGHKRFLSEFGEDAFTKMTIAATEWANNWVKTATAPFVGVSICFGKRTGRTGLDFLDIFTEDDLISICRGKGSGDKIANSLYVSNDIPSSLEGLFDNLKEISKEEIYIATQSFKIAMRPINPITEGTNRGKNVYTQFIPVRKLQNKTKIESANELFQLGKFEVVEPNCLNHNRILDNLEAQYNIVVQRKK